MYANFWYYSKAPILSKELKRERKREREQNIKELQESSFEISIRNGSNLL